MLPSPICTVVNDPECTPPTPSFAVARPAMHYSFPSHVERVIQNYRGSRLDEASGGVTVTTGPFWLGPSSECDGGGPGGGISA